MRVVIVRREPGVALSMDVYADNLVAWLKVLQPDWTIVEVAPNPWSNKENLWHSGTGLRKYFERFWHHPRNVSKQEADIFHIIDHSNAHIAYWLKKIGHPVVVTCHDLVQFVYPEILRAQSRLPALSLASWRFSVQGMRVANHVIAVSANTAKDINEMLKIEPERIAVVPNGVESKFCVLPLKEVEQLRQKYTSSPEAICLLNVGSTHQRKNIFTILQVVEVLKARGLTVCLWKTGDDFTVEQKKFIHDRGLEKDIIYLGKPDQETLVQIYNAADVLLSPSLYEGFGLTILEAMACGTPVITSNVSSLPEVAGDAAILVEPMDTQAIAEAVYRLQKDRIYRQLLVEQGLARVKLFMWEKTAQQVAKSYERVLKQ